ncbi:hypothetical protein JXM83_00635 [Candidatus Woesearchaeota archaeon]|nr:hypothetical protein [Candidatus Woesearchaeota archaeon]
MDSAENNNDILELGGNIELSGFSDYDRSTMIIVKKMVGTFAKKLNEHSVPIEKISITAKKVHGNDPKTAKAELHAKVITQGNPVTAETVSNNLFFGIDEVLKKIESQFKK